MEGALRAVLHLRDLRAAGGGLGGAGGGRRKAEEEDADSEDESEDDDEVGQADISRHVIQRILESSYYSPRHLTHFGIIVS